MTGDLGGADPGGVAGGEELPWMSLAPVLHAAVPVKQACSAMEHRYGTVPFGRGACGSVHDDGVAPGTSPVVPPRAIVFPVSIRSPRSWAGVISGF